MSQPRRCPASRRIRRAFTRSNAVVEADLFKSREFGTASAALFLFFIAFATLLLISVLYLQDMWHYSALDAGLGMLNRKSAGENAYSTSTPKR